MALLQGASRLSLGTWGRRSSKYQKFINLANIFLCISSIIIMGIAVHLMYYYHLHDLHFWHNFFWETPILMLSIGVATFFTCLYGFLISSMEKRTTLIIMAIFLSIIFLIQVYSVYISNELRFIFTSETSGGKGIDEIRHYNEKGYENVTKKWDRIQSHLRCCGASESYNTGYQDYLSASAFQSQIHSKSKSVPDSCCKEQEEGCGIGKFNEGNEPDPKIYIDGCLAILKELLKNEAVSIMYVYMGMGLILALIELITVALTCAYVAQITRRIRAHDQYSHYNSANGDESMPSLKTSDVVSL